MRRDVVWGFLVAFAGGLVVACGSGDPDAAGCATQAVNGGEVTTCEMPQFGGGAPAAWDCAPAKDPGVASLQIRSGGARPCPAGTEYVPGSLEITDPKAPEGSVPPGATGPAGSSPIGTGGSSATVDGPSPVGSESASDAPSGSESPSGGSDAPTGSDAPSTSSSSGGAPASCDAGYHCTTRGRSTTCVCARCDEGFLPVKNTCRPKGNNGVGNGEDPQPPGDPPINDGAGTGPGNPGNKGGAKK